MKIFEIFGVFRFWFRLADQKLVRTEHFDHTEHAVAYPHRYGIDPKEFHTFKNTERLDYDPKVIWHMLEHGWVRVAMSNDICYIEAKSVADAKLVKEYCDIHFLNTREYRVDIRRSAIRRGKSIIWVK